MEQFAYSIRQTAQALGLCPNSVRALIKTGQLSHVRAGRRVLVPVASVKAMVEQATTTNTAPGRRRVV